MWLLKLTIMKPNVGQKDAAVRMVLGVLIALAGFYFKSWWGLLAFVPLVTAYFNFCPLYKLLGINTCKTKIKVH
jgi:Protein of unknown function (DUF2892)